MNNKNENDFGVNPFGEGDFSNQYGNLYTQKNVNEGKLARGVLIGVLSTLICIVFIVIVGGMALINTGHLHIATDGSIYVQPSSATDGEGIGSEVSGKLNLLESVLQKGFYFDDADKETAEDMIYKAYLSAYGDRYTVYYNPDEYKSILESTSGKFYGIGAACTKMEDGTIALAQVYDDSPAKKAGLKEGDRIKYVDGTDITSMDLSEAIALIKGDKGTTVTLTIIRDETSSDVLVTRDEIKVQTVSYSMMEGNIGYISISQFDEVTTKQFKSAIEDLTNQGMVGLVIDIRNNPGGVLTTVKDMLEYILPDGLIVYTEDVNGDRQNYIGDDNNELNVPLAVLVNGDSASASEIFAGAVQDYKKGAIIGTQTFGKGIVQTIQPLTDGSAIKYTIAKYFTPNGQDIHGKGVTPDMVVEPDSESDTDNQLEAAINYVKGQLAN
jgi:carboxyl-terminal processing protease